MTTLIKASKKITLHSANSSDIISSNDTKKSDIKFAIPPTVFHSPYIIYNTVSVTHCEIPVSFYIINEYNDFLKLVRTTTPFTETSVSLTRGNYDANSFMSMLTTLFTGDNYSISFNKSTGKFTISNSAFDFFIDITSTCGLVMGFKNGVEYTSTTQSLTLPGMANFLGTKNIRIVSENIKTENFDSIGKQDYLLNLQINEPPYGIVLFSNINNFDNIFELEFMNHIHLKLYDDSGNLLDFNDVDWSITLQFNSFYYKLPPKTLHDSIKEAIEKQKQTDDKDDAK